ELIKVAGRSEISLPEKYRGESIRLIKNPQADPGRRSLALDFLSLSGDVGYRELYSSVMNPGEPLQVQLAALRSMGTLSDSVITRHIENKWTGFTSELK